MPTLLRINGFRFFFYSNENNEPAHVHVEKGSGIGKIWLEPSVAVSYFRGFSSSEQNSIMDVIDEHSSNFKKKWYEHFPK